MTDDSDAPYPMMQPIECRALELLESRWYDSAQHSQRAIEPVIKADIQTVCDQVPATEMARIPDELVERKTTADLELVRAYARALPSRAANGGALPELAMAVQRWLRTRHTFTLTRGRIDPAARSQLRRRAMSW